MNPKVTCLCITYNRPKLLKELLYCFLAQDYENKELIIVNDQDNITYSFDHPQVKIINLTERFDSVGSKRNYTKTLVSNDSKYVFWLDDDDIYYPDFVSHMVKQHENNPAYDMIRPHMTHFSTHNKISNYKNGNVGFPTASFTKEFSDRVDFEPLMFGSDQSYIRKANALRLKDNKVTSHIRWGLNIYHVSGGSSEIYNKEIQKKTWEASAHKQTESQTIVLIPEISDEVKNYYKVY